jgi:hypothetical protein
LSSPHNANLNHANSKHFGYPAALDARYRTTASLAHATKGTHCTILYSSGGDGFSDWVGADGGLARTTMINKFIAATVKEYLTVQTTPFYHFRQEGRHNSPFASQSSIHDASIYT